MSFRSSLLLCAIALSAVLATRADALDVTCAIGGADSGGWAVATAGDFDGDGMADIAMGGPCAHVSGLKRGGRVLVFSGATGSRLVSLKGTKANQRMGASLAFLPDVNGDGRDELIVGSFGWDVPTGTGGTLAGAGKVEVVTIDKNVLLSLEGSFGAANFGEAVAALPDVDGDGVADFVVGAGDDRDGNEKVGRAYLISGAAGTVLDTSTGASNADSWGSAVASADRVDGDGIPDIIVAGNLADDVETGGGNNGIVKVFAGPTLSNEIVTVRGRPDDKLGHSIAVAGARGFYAGAPGATAQGKNKAGSVTLFGWDGAPSTPIVEEAGQITAAFGSAVAVVGDIDGDGVSDVVASAPNSNVGGLTSAGRVHAFSGATHARLWTVNGSRSNEGIGQVLAGAPDFNGDGVPDVLIGAPGDAPNGRRGAGSVRVVSGADGDEIMRIKGRRGLETRLFVVGFRAGHTPHLRSFDRKGRRRELRRDVFRSLDGGGLSVAVLDDGTDPAPGDMKIVLGTGPGAGRDTVEVVRAGRRSVRLSSFRGIGGDYTGGVTVAAGQVVGSATQEIVVGEADADDGNVEVRIYQPFDIDPLGRINWFQQNVFPAFQSTDIIEAQPVDATGVNVAVGNVIAEPLGTSVVEEIVVGPTGGAPVVRILSGDGIVLREWLAYVPGQNSGTAVAVGDVNGDGIDEVITTPAQGLPWVKVWNGDGTLFVPSGSAEGVSFFAFLTNVTGGLRPAAADVDLDGRAEILVASGPGIDGVVKAFEAATVSGEPVPVQGWTDFKPFGPGSADGLAIASTDRFLRH